eukprot:gene12939-8795_t
MGRSNRRFIVRLRRLFVVAAAGAAAYHRWGLRASAVAPPPETGGTRAQGSTRAQRLARLTSREAPYDVLVVGGGLCGLYAAVDAAQRGLSVALVEAQDLGAGYTSHAAGLAPGPIPYLQRALRQRDLLFVAEALLAMRRQRVWRNVCYAAGGEGPHAGLVPHQRVALVAPHTTERLELLLMGLAGTLLTPLFGPWELHGGWVRAAPSRSGDGTALPATGVSAGAVVSYDYFLDGPRLAVRLARTAEALGVTLVTYAPLTALSLEAAAGSGVVARGTVVDRIGVEELGALHRDRHLHTVCARRVINCGGAWADAVRGLLPETRQDPVPAAFTTKWQVQSFLVAPRGAVTVGRGGEKVGLAALELDGLHTVPTLYSFSPVMALPWVDRCVLLGPSASSLSSLPPLHDPHLIGSTALRFTGGFDATRHRVMEALHTAGIHVEPGRLLSCLSSWTPLLRTTQELPWLTSTFLRKGYHVDVSRQPALLSEEEEAAQAAPQSPLLQAAADRRGREDPSLPPAAAARLGATLPFVHVYGGIPSQARDIAAEAVDAALDVAPAASPLPHSRTERLGLLPLPYAGLDASPAAAVAAMARDGYAERVTDVLFRRLATAYTSPGEAAAAVADIAGVMGNTLGWTKRRIAIEIRQAREELACVAVGGQAQLVSAVTNHFFSFSQISNLHAHMICFFVLSCLYYYIYIFVYFTIFSFTQELLRGAVDHLIVGVRICRYFHVTYAPRGVLSLLIYGFFLLLVIAASALICWFTTEFWTSTIVDCGKASGMFQGHCGLHVVTTKGTHKFWTCSESFNAEFLMSTGSFVRAFVSISEGAGRATDILISVPIGNVDASVYNNPEDLPQDAGLDAIESITFIPGLLYRASGNRHTIESLAAPQLRYSPSTPYDDTGADNTGTSFSGGPICAHSEYEIRFSADVGDESPSCQIQRSSINGILAEFQSFTSFCAVSSRTVFPVLVRQSTGGLDLLHTDDTTFNIGYDLALLNAFTWRITLHFPEECMPHTPQVGYSLKYVYIQFITIAWGFHFLFWQLRGIFATNGLIDLNAHYQNRIKPNGEEEETPPPPPPQPVVAEVKRKYKIPPGDERRALEPDGLTGLVDPLDD